MPLSLNRAETRNGPPIREAARLVVAVDRTGLFARFTGRSTCSAQ